MAERSHSCKADVLRKAMALYEVALDAKAQGKKFGVAESADKLTREIIGV